METNNLHFIISYDFLKNNIDENRYNDIQSDVSRYLNKELGKQILNNVWYKRWTNKEKENFIEDCKICMLDLMTEDEYNKNFRLIVCHTFDIDTEPKHFHDKLMFNIMFS